MSTNMHSDYTEPLTAAQLKLVMLALQPVIVAALAEGLRPLFGKVAELITKLEAVEELLGETRVDVTCLQDEHDRGNAEAAAKAQGASN